MNKPLQRSASSYERIRLAAYTELELENHEQVLILYCLTIGQSLCRLIHILGGMVGIYHK